ncbi:MAG: hypothetical protein ACRDHY_06490, partial [Anaerolineales bacterium]
MLNLRPIGGSIPPLALVLLSLACNLLSGPAGTAPPTIPAIEATQIGATQVSMPTDTAAPQGVEVTCGGVHFWFDPSLASGATCETVAAVPDTGDAPPWDVGPEHTRITFEGYVLPGIFHMPRIYVYPVADYESMNPGAAQIIPALQAFLETKPQTFDNSIPFLPLFNAVQILRAQVQYLDFQNGTGVRFLTL